MRTSQARGPGDLIARGKALFLEEWSPGAPSRHGGDGLGPVYNDTSCVACHNLGGSGGAGPASKNVDLLSAIVTPSDDERGRDPLRNIRLMHRQQTAELAKIRGVKLPERSSKGAPPDRAPLNKLHAGFRDVAERRPSSLRDRRRSRTLADSTAQPRHGLLGGASSVFAVWPRAGASRPV